MSNILSAEEIERGLTNQLEWERILFAERTDWTPTPEQVERGLTDASPGVRIAFAHRADTVLNPSQIERGLEDENEYIAWDFEKRRVEWMARWEAHTLKQRHSHAIQFIPSKKLEAL
jgi:hypothetical protein